MNNNLSFYETMGLSIMATILQSLHLDTAKQALMKNICVPIRDQLNLLYPPSAS